MLSGDVPSVAVTDGNPRVLQAQSPHLRVPISPKTNRPCQALASLRDSVVEAGPTYQGRLEPNHGLHSPGLAPGQTGQ